MKIFNCTSVKVSPVFNNDEFLDVSFSSSSNRKKPKSSGSKLHTAVVRGDLIEVDYWLSIGSSINHKDTRCITPLHLAVFTKNLVITEYLLERGARQNIKTRKGLDCLTIAKNNNDQDMIELLNKHKKGCFNFK